MADFETIRIIILNSNIDLNHIQQAIVTLRDAYQPVNMDELADGENLYEILRGMANERNFEMPEIRLAYLHNYFTCTSFITQECWRNLTLNQNIKYPEKEIKVCALGGGPGTDLIGFLNFLRSKEMSQAIVGTILEHYVKWEKEGRVLLNQNGLEDIRYQQFTFEDVPTEDTKNAIKKSDVISMVKIFSELRHDANRYVYCQNLVRNMKSGALLFFVDHTGGLSLKYLRETMELAGLQLLNQIGSQDINVTDDIIAQVRDNRIQELDHPQLKTKVTAILWQKK